MKLKLENKIIIQELISEGKTDEVFKHIDLKDKNILLVKSRYNSGKNQYHLGIIDNSEWQKIQNQINNAILDFIAHVENEDNIPENLTENNKKEKRKQVNNISVDVTEFIPNKKVERGILQSIKTRLYLMAIKSSEVLGFTSICIGMFLIYISITWFYNTDKSKELILLLPSGIGSPDDEKPIFSPEIMLFLFGFITIVAGFVCTLVSQLFKNKYDK